MRKLNIIIEKDLEEFKLEQIPPEAVIIDQKYISKIAQTLL